MRAKLIQLFSSTKKWDWSELLFFILLAVVAFYSLFYHLGDAPLAMWDEARYANNAIDMLENPHPFKVEHMGQPDRFNTKPALVIAMQAFCMHLFGINAFSVRLPSALFGLFTLLLVYAFAQRFFQHRFSGWLAVAILLCSPGFMGEHIVRTGDLDAVLVFWLLLGLFTAVSLWVHRPKNTLNHYVLLGISVVAGFLTKGIAGFFFLPFLFLIPLFLGRWVFLRDKNLYLSGLAVLLVCGSYYALRNYFMPGYIDLVFKYELARYTQEVMNWQVHPFLWYVEQMSAVRFYPFMYLLPFTLAGMYFFKGAQQLAFGSLLITGLGYLLLISYPGVKLLWYDAPLYPVFALLIALSFGVLFERLFNHWKVPKARLLLYIIALLLLIQPYRRTTDSLNKVDALVYNLTAEGVYLRQLRTERPGLKQISIYKVETDPAHYDQLLFYIRRYQKEEGCTFRLTQQASFKTGEIVMICKEADRQRLALLYPLITIHRTAYGAIYLVGEKQP